MPGIHSHLHSRMVALVKKCKEFASLDFFLMLAGCRIHIPSRGYRIANLIFRLLVFVSYAFTCLVHVFAISKSQEPERVFNVDRSMPQEPVTFAFYADAIFGTIFMITMIRNRNAFQSILSQAAFLSDSQRWELRFHSCFSVLLLLVHFLLYFVLVGTHLQKADGWHIVVDPVRTYMVFNSWFTGGACVVTFFETLVAAREETFFQHLNNTLEKGYSKTVERVALILEHMRLRELEDSVKHAFSPTPSLWAVFYFIKLGEVYFNLEFHQEWFRLWFFEFYTLIVVLFSLNVFWKRGAARTKEMTTAVEKTLIKSGQMAEMSDVMHELRKRRNYSGTTVRPKYRSPSVCPLRPDVTRMEV